jgi:hypothetical protein
VNEKYAMKKLLLTLIFAVMSSSAMAEWVPVDTSNRGISYVDTATVRRKASNKVKIWELVDYKTVQGSADFQYNSAMFQTQYDCKEEQYQFLYSSFHSENMGGGDVVRTNNNPSKWAPVPPDSIVKGLWKFACGK